MITTQPDIRPATPKWLDVHALRKFLRVDPQAIVMYSRPRRHGLTTIMKKLQQIKRKD